MAKATDHLRVPPHNLEAETSVLGSLMLDKDAVIKIADLLKVGDFYKDDHNVIYETMLALYEDREPIGKSGRIELPRLAGQFCSFRFERRPLCQSGPEKSPAPPPHQRRERYRRNGL